MRESWEVKNISSRDLTGFLKPRRNPMPNGCLGRSAAAGLAAAVFSIPFDFILIAIF
jgi:hypothetical protein